MVRSSMFSVFTRDGVEKDARAKEIEAAELARVRKDLNDQRRILEEDIFLRVEKMLTGKVADRWSGRPGQRRQSGQELPRQAAPGALV